MIPGAKLSVYQGIGHAPFFEDAPRFNPSSPPSCAAPRRGIDIAAAGEGQEKLARSCRRNRHAFQPMAPRRKV